MLYLLDTYPSIVYIIVNRLSMFEVILGTIAILVLLGAVGLYPTNRHLTNKEEIKYKDIAIKTAIVGASLLITSIALPSSDTVRNILVDRIINKADFDDIEYYQYYRDEVVKVIKNNY